MARTTRAKKQAEAPKVNIGTEIFESLRDLEKLKGIPVDYMVERLKQALVNARRFGTGAEASCGFPEIHGKPHHRQALPSL